MNLLKLRTMWFKIILFYSSIHLILAKSISKDFQQMQTSPKEENFNLCDAFEESIKKLSLMNNTQSLINKLLKNVKERAESAKNYAKSVKEKMINHLNDSDFEDGIKHVTNQWDPKMYEKLNEVIKTNKSDDIIKTIFRYIHLYTLGWEKIIRDKSLEEVFLEEFKEIQIYTKLLLCEISLAVKIVNHDWWKSNTKLEHPNKLDLNLNESRKLIRDYIELKDYIRVLEIIMLNL